MSICNDDSHHTSIHIFLECTSAKKVWEHIHTWLCGLPRELRGSLTSLLEMETCLFGVSTMAHNKWCKLQCWPVVWSSVLFELGTAWTAMIYGGEESRSTPAILVAAWSLCSYARRTIQERKPTNSKSSTGWRRAFWMRSPKAGGFLVLGL